VLAEASDDGELLRVLTESIKLVSKGSLELLAGDVGELGLGDERLGLGSNELLLENNNLGAVGLLVLELSNLISDLLLACERSCQQMSLVVRKLGKDIRSLLGWTEASMLRMLLMVTRYWSYLSTNWSSSSPIS
jgi:hypothetical protein